MWQTEEDSEHARPADTAAQPGLVIVFSGAAPALCAFTIPAGEGLVLGRDALDDERVSRHHARVRAADGALVVHDLGSRNGTFVAGRRIGGDAWVHPPAVIRVGRTIGVLVRDIRPFVHARVALGDTAPPFGGAAGRGAPTVDGAAVIGPRLAVAWQRIAEAARTGDHLLVTGESGTGKELAARAFHAAARAPGELVSVNCAAIPAGVADRLLFGTRRGAYSGADRDADGYLVSADGGTLFLDEIGELEPAVQAKLLRVLETREVLPLGAARPRKVVLRIVAATLRDLRGEVAARRFREDLYHRVGRPEVHLLPLRERPEDIPWLIARTAAAAAPGLAIHPGVIERCLLRPWPGNVRELAGEIRRAARACADAGATELRADALDPVAGLRIDPEGAIPPPLHRQSIHPAATEPALPLPPLGTPPPAPAPLPDRATIARSLLAEGGNVARTARTLGLHRNQLRRFLARHPDVAAGSSDDS